MYVEQLSTRIILPTILCRYKTFSHALREEYDLIVFENWMLMSVSETKRRSNGNTEKLHNDDLHCLYSPPNITGVIK